MTSSTTFASIQSPMKLILSSDQSKSCLLQGKLLETTIKERLSHARNRFLMFFALAIVSVFIPVAHFFLVPLFLLLAIVAGVKSYGLQYRLEISPQPPCFQCQTPLKPIYFLGQDLRIRCEKCFAQYSIETS